MKILKEITNEMVKDSWNNAAQPRYEQIKSGKDTSYSDVLIPAVIKSSEDCDFSNVVDLGCGTGMLTKYLTNKSVHIDAVDFSDKNIEIAKAVCIDADNVDFYISDIETYRPQNLYTLAVSNMVLMDLVNLNEAVQNIYNFLVNKGVFIFTITHPCFWSVYKKYYNKDWFHYLEDICFDQQFDIHNEKGKFNTYLIHRPLEKYINVLAQCNFKIVKMEELLSEKFMLPRFLIVKCEKTK